MTTPELNHVSSILVGEIKIEPDEEPENFDNFDSKETPLELSKQSEQPISSVSVDEIKIEPDEHGGEEKLTPRDSQQPSNDSDLMQVTQCEKCKRFFEGTRGLKNHALSCKGIDDPRYKFCCEICSVSFRFRTSLEDHMNKHKGVNPYKCRVQCDRHFYSIALRNLHEKKCKGEQQICPFCDRKLSNPGMLDRHLSSEHSGDRHECNICGKVFARNNKLVLHQRMMHFNDKPWHPCEVCGKQFKEARMLRRHMGRHMEEKPFRCELCDAGLSSKVSFDLHMRYAHKKATLQCKTCGNEFKKNSDLLTHRRRVHKDVLTEDKKTLEKSVSNIKTEFDQTEAENSTDSKEIFLAVTECETCHRFFDSNEGIVSHVLSCNELNESPDMLYTCHICTVSFRTPTLLAAHLQEHKDGKLFKCRKVCEKWFYDSKRLEEHERLCRIDKWACLVCGIKLANAQARSRHMRTVHAEPRYGCETCGRKFTRRTNLTAHERVIHSDNAPKFPCEVCGRIFTQARKMRKHMEKHVKPEPCEGGSEAM